MHARSFFLFHHYGKLSDSTLHPDQINKKIINGLHHLPDCLLFRYSSASLVVTSLNRLLKQLGSYQPLDNQFAERLQQLVTRF